MTTMPDISGAIAAAEELLRRALVRGDATAQFHRQLADLREQQAAQQAAVEQQAAAATAETAKLREARISELAQRHIDAAAQRLRDRLDRLRAPSPPTTPKGHA